MPQTSSTSNSYAPSSEGSSDRLEQIRQLLFGQQIQAQTERIDRLEVKLDQTCQELKHIIHSELAQLETRLTNRLVQVEQSITQQQQSAQNLQNTTTQFKQTLEEQIAATADQLRAEMTLEKSQQSEKAQADRQHLATLFQSLSEELGH